MVEKVFALGGSTIRENFEQLGELAEALEKNQQFVAVVGAGHLKKHQDAVRDSCTKAETDLVGIAATRLNARTVQALMEEAYPEVPESVEEVKKAASNGKNIVMGGVTPGISTDAVASIIAELYDAELYFVKDVNGIYTSDPGKDDEAELLKSIKVEKLLEMTSGKNTPGTYSIVDETAVRIVERSELDAKVFRGTLENLETPEDVEGTDIVFNS